jgi:hypothetical protein
MQSVSVCCVTGCERSPAATLDVRALCRAHFIAACYDHFDEYGRWLEENRFRDSSMELVRRFLCECTRQATELSHNATDLDNLERARLLDILFRATELSRQLRRSPRRVTTVAVRLSSEKLGRSWEEDARTRVISRYGASLECAHPVEVGDSLTVTRTDCGQSVRARVVWRQPRPGNRFEVGLEFLHCDNFWDLDWNSTEAVLWQEEPTRAASRPLAK